DRNRRGACPSFHRRNPHPCFSANGDRPEIVIPHAFHFLLLIVGEGGNLLAGGAGSNRRLVPLVFAHQAGRGRAGEAIPASRTARMPVRKIPSKVPAPPIEATGAPRPLILSR